MRRFCSSKCYGQSLKRTEKDFWPRVQKGDPRTCWLWTGSVGKNGYGTILFEREHDYAHRIAYRLVKGDIPEGQVIRHLCNVRLCCNPQHLTPGSYEENNGDQRDARLLLKFATFEEREAELLRQFNYHKARCESLIRAVKRLRDSNSHQG